MSSIKNLKKFISIFLFVFLSFVISAQADTFKIEAPKNWKVVNGLFGMPYSILGPNINSQGRSVITVNKVTEEDFPFKFFEKHKYFESYKKSKQKWADKTGNEIIRFFQDDLENLKNFNKKYNTGVSYIKNGKGFMEKNFYLSCNKKLYILKYLMPLINRTEDLVFIEKSIGSFRCD